MSVIQDKLLLTWQSFKKNLLLGPLLKYFLLPLTLIFITKFPTFVFCSADSTERGRQHFAREAEPSLRPETYLWAGLWVGARSCRRSLCEAVRRPLIHLANWVLFSLAFLNPVLGITSRPEQEGIPVIMCSGRAASGCAAKTQRDTDTAVRVVYQYLVYQYFSEISVFFFDVKRSKC